MLSARPSPFRGSLEADALLFDLDGTIIDSSALFDTVWTDWARAHGIAPADILAIHHGRRIPDTIRAVTPAGFDVITGEAEVLQMASSSLHGLRLIPGIANALKSLPSSGWGIVTSSYPDLTCRWLDHFGLPRPPVLITAHDVRQGKPHPEGYQKGASALGVATEQCIVFEDAPAGIAAAGSAGAMVIVVATMLRSEALIGRRWIADYSGVSVETRKEQDRIRFLAKFL